MIRRKPAWIEQQIEKARSEGAFENLPGHGKPPPDLDEVYDPGWWAKKLVRRERISLLPAALGIRRKVERVLEEIWSLSEESLVRGELAELNAEIGKANARVTSGPATRIGLLDVDAIVERWRVHGGEAQK